MGSRNVYCIDLFSREEFDFAAWQKRWNSDTDSIWAREASPVHDPLLWKLLPGSPGYQQGAGGKDLGADVSRIGVIRESRAQD